jgi:outer membrane protein OmpA-like peptidoglycan-associated protein
MSLCQIYGKRAFSAVALSVVVCAFSVMLTAQSGETVPKAEVFAGYQWLNPGATVPDGNVPPNPFKVPSMSKGIGASFAYNFDKFWALEADYGGNWSKTGNEHEYSIGPKVTWRGEGVNFFAHTLLGLNNFSIKDNIPSTTGIGAILGGGMDLKLTKALNFRLFEADYVWARHNYSKIVDPSDPQLRRVGFSGARLRTGLVFNIGGEPEVPPAAACTIDRSEVLVGEPLHVTVAPTNFNPKHTLKYEWTSTGAKIDGKDTGASIDTNGAAPGNYTATAKVSDPKKKKGGEASCISNFTVKPLNPPQISCSASPSIVVVGGTSSVTCTCTSPDNVPVTVAGWSATSGSVSGSGNSATLNTTGATPGTATVNATCTDSRGLTASTTSSVTVNNPPPPPPPQVDPVVEKRLALRSVYFATNKPTEKEPTGGLVKSQEDTLESLASDFKQYLGWRPEAHLTLKGHADQRGSVAFNQALSERRVARVKSYLVEHGVPEASLQTEALGKEHNLTAAEVKGSIDEDSTITKEERARIMRNMKTIIWASNRRVDVTLNAPGQDAEHSVRQYPFNAADSLTLLGGREVVKKAAAPAKKGAKKPAKK